MIKGLYAAASAMLAGLARQSALAHNVANIDTPGFKQLLLPLMDFLQVPVNQPPAEMDALGRSRLVGELGLGVAPGPEGSDFSDGGLRQTGHAFDFAIQGSGFFRLETPEGERYTRDGRFARDSEGNLVTVDGYFVLDQNGSRITLPEGDLFVTPDGALQVDGSQVAVLGLAAFQDPATELERAGDNTFTALDTPSGDEPGQVRQGYLEGSNVNPAQVMTQMVAVARAYEAAQQLVQVQDDLLGRALSTLGRL